MQSSLSVQEKESIFKLNFLITWSADKFLKKFKRVGFQNLIL